MSSVQYFDGNHVDVQDGVFVWQGIARNYDNKLIMVGTSNPSPTTGQGVVYFGNCEFTKYNAFILNVPNAEYTSVYGCRFLKFDNNNKAIYRFVGSYNNFNDVTTYAFIYEGPLDETTKLKNWRLKVASNFLKAPINFAHSTDGVLVVGNSGNTSDNKYFAWIYDTKNNKYTTYKYPDSISTTLYGIVQNSNSSYTMCGGFTRREDERVTGFVCDINFDATTGTITPVIEGATTLGALNIKHFEGISKTVNPNVYKLAADGIGLQDKSTAFAVKVKRLVNRQKFEFFGEVPLKYEEKGFTTSNSIQNNIVVGLYADENNEHVAWSARVDKF